MPRALALVVGCYVAVAAGAAAELSPISTRRSDHFFSDAEGRVRIFHGAARVQKNPPWYFEDLLGDAEPVLMAQLGFNVLRLGFMWSGYNPAPGVFNATYLEVVKSQVAKLNSYGIYVLLDMHQDILSSKFCLYDGVPRWVIDKSEPAHPYPYPLGVPDGNNCTRTGSAHSPCHCSRSWSENAVTVAAATAYQDIYDNKHGMLDDLATFWAKAAEQLKDIPGIIGYEIMNEPFAGNFFADPLLLLPGVAGRQNLQRMHDAVAMSIRREDTSHIVFFEPVTWGMLEDGNISGSGFTHVPGGAQYSNVSAYAYHYYCNSFDAPSSGNPRGLCDAALAPSVFRAVKADVARLGGASMMTEGLACDQNNATKQKECIEVQEQLDEHLFSWTDYGDSQMDVWSVAPVQRRTWARSYARAVAGTPLNMSFRISSPEREFSLCYSFGAAHAGTSADGTWDVAATTEIFASRRYHYPHGVHVRTTPNLVAVLPTSGQSCERGGATQLGCDIITVHPTREAAARLRGGAPPGEEEAGGHAEADAAVAEEEIGCVRLTAKLG
jgi:endoglycosylceramidase